MDGESESPLIRVMDLSGQWDNRICARACARGRRRGFGAVRRPAYAALSAQPVAAPASSLPHSVVLLYTPLRAWEADCGGCTGCIPGQRLDLARFQWWNLLPTVIKSLDFKNCKMEADLILPQPGTAATLYDVRWYSRWLHRMHPGPALSVLEVSPAI